MISKLAVLLTITHIQGLHGILQNHDIDGDKKIHGNAFPIGVPDHGTKASIFTSHVNHIQMLPKKSTNVRKNKGINLPVAFQISHQFLVPSLHVIPIHSSLQHHHVPPQDNTRIQYITHIGTPTNATHQTQLVPILIPYPYHNQYVPVHDLTVIPLHGRVHNDNKAQFRMMEKKENDEEPMNRFRTFYGGFGTGLFFGGHGAGHGFYAYG